MPKLDNRDDNSISISHVIHGFAAHCTFGDTTLACHVNASCSQASGLSNQTKAITRILMKSNTICCSGVLVNNACNDLTPYVLTAFHCVDFDVDRYLDSNEEDDIEDWVFSFKYISPTCKPSSEPSSYITYTGASDISLLNATDFLLVKMDDTPSYTSGLTYAGWSNSSTQSGVTYSLSHPKGDVMKFTKDNDNPDANDSYMYFKSYNNKTFGIGVDMLWEVDWDLGALEPGSSGGPLFNSDKRVIGQYVGGWHVCNTDSI